MPRGVGASGIGWKTLRERQRVPSIIFFFPCCFCFSGSHHVQCELSTSATAAAVSVTARLLLYICAFLFFFYFCWFVYFFAPIELRPRPAQGGTLPAECTSAISMRSRSHGDNVEAMSAVNIHSPGEKCSARSVNYTAAHQRHRVQSELTPPVLEKQSNNDCNQRRHRPSVSRSRTTKRISIMAKRGRS